MHGLTVSCMQFSSWSATEIFWGPHGFIVRWGLVGGELVAKLSLNAPGCSVESELSVSTSTTKVWEFWKRRWKRHKGLQMGRRAAQCWLLTWWGCCFSQLTAAVVTCIKPGQDQANESSSMSGGEVFKAPLLMEKLPASLLMAADGGDLILFWGCGP